MPSAKDFTTADVLMFNKMNEQAHQSMMGDGGDGVLGTLGMENLDSGNALRLQWICEFITEEQFNRQLGDVQQALTVWVRTLNQRWGGTALSPFTTSLVLHLAFTRGAQEATNELYIIHLGRWMRSWPSRARSNPLASKAAKSDEQKLSFAGGQVTTVKQQQKK
jgi:hypothetical protein